MMLEKSKLFRINTIRKSKKCRKTSSRCKDKKKGKYLNSLKQPRKGIWSIGNKSLLEYTLSKHRTLFRWVNRKKRIKNKFNSFKKNKLNLWIRLINIIPRAFSLKSSTWQLWVYLWKMSQKLWATVLELTRMLHLCQKIERAWLWITPSHKWMTKILWAATAKFRIPRCQMST
jgi:hypothetical protein